MQMSKKKAIVGGAGLLMVGVIGTGVALNKSSFEKPWDMRVGQCAELPAHDETIDTIRREPCTEIHDAEVFATGIPPGKAYPGDAAVKAYGNQLCADTFEPYVGKSLRDSEVSFVFTRPTKDTWFDKEDVVHNQVACYATIDNAKFKTSLKGSKR
jgi:hypothetical protein